MINKNPDTIRINFQIKGLVQEPVIFHSYYGSTSSSEDTAITNRKGEAQFVLPTPKTGLYKLSFGKRNDVNLIINGEDISFQTFLVNSTDSMVIEQSTENKIFYELMDRQRKLQQKQQLLYPVLQQYPKESAFYKKTLNEYNTITENYHDYLLSLKQKYPSSYTVKYMAFLQSPLPDVTMSQQEIIHRLKENFWDDVPAIDSSLLRSDAIVRKINNYLSLYQVNKNHTTHDEESYKKAVDQIATAFSSNDKVFEFVIRYLSEIFQENKAHETLAYLHQKYVPQMSCVNEELKLELENKLERFTATSIGQKAPDFTIPNANGDPINLYSVKNDHVLLFFWASWCPHCEQVISHLKHMYKEKKQNLEVLAISLDENKQEWKHFIEAHELPWLNVAELQGWEGPVIEDYNVYATPTMVLVDKHKNITAKPSSVRELTRLIEKE